MPIFSEKHILPHIIKQPVQFRRHQNPEDIGSRGGDNLNVEIRQEQAYELTLQLQDHSEAILWCPC